MNGYPKNKMQIVVVDSGSADKTSTIVREKFQNEVRLLREEYRPAISQKSRMERIKNQI